MVVCPQCRTDNAEEAAFCSNCGRSLAPDQASVGRSVRREPGPIEEEIDLAPQKASPLPGILTLVLLAALVAGATTWFLVRPSPCMGKFASERYPYCVTVPNGWVDGTQTSGEAQADAFQPRQAGTVVLVLAEDLEQPLTTPQYADLIVESLEADGYFPSAPQPEVIDGVEALAVEFGGTSEDGTRYRQRLVVTVNGNRGWVIQFAGSATLYEQARRQFEGMLQTWQWK